MGDAPLVSPAWRRTYLALLWLTNFVDPRITLRILVAGLAEPLGALIGLAFLLMTLALLRGYRGDKLPLAWASLTFGALSSVRALAGGVPLSWVVQTIPPYLAGAAAVLSARDPRFLSGIRNGFIFAMFLHACVVAFPGSAINNAIGEQTAYGLDSATVGNVEVAARATGLLNAPGFLSLYASIGLAISLDIARFSPGAASILLLSSIVCGVATGNRSFVIVSAVVVILAAAASAMGRGGAKRLLAIAGFTAAAAGVVYSTIYAEAMQARFDAEVIDRDSEVRLRGTSGLLDALETAAEHPIVGALAADARGRAVGVWNGREFINPHNNFVWVLSTRGVFAFAAYTWAIFAALHRAWRTRGRTTSLPMSSQTLLLALLAGLATCSVEPLGEVGPMLILMGLCLGSTSVSQGATVVPLPRADGLRRQLPRAQA